MRDITEDEIRSAFGEKTFSRGQTYFENGYVERGVKKGDNLIGTVLGSAPHPYKVKMQMKDNIYSRCTCPVGEMCKHGAALLLQWINKKDLFVDCDCILVSLREKSKEELIKIISSMLENDPALALRLAFSEEVTQKRVNIEAISRKLHYVGREFLDYYAVPGVVEELEEVKERGDKLREEGHLEDAVEVYLLLIEWGIDAFENGVDDSDGELGDVIIGCVEDFNSIAENFREEQKRDLLYRILKIVEVEDHGLETKEMLYRIVTKENIAFVEEELLRRMPTSGEKHHIDYHRRNILDLISDLYWALGMQEDALRVMKEAGFKNEDDYIRMVRALIKRGEHEEAFHLVREGLRFETERDNRLGELYFMLLHQFLLEEKREDIQVNVEEMMTTALRLLSFSFDSERYSIMREVFERIELHGRLISAIKEKCKDSVVIDMLLYENRTDEAVERSLSSPALHPAKLMEVAGVAQERGKDEATLKLTGKAVKNGLTSADASACELIEFFVKESDEKELKKAIDCVRNIFIARIFADALIKRNQEYAVMLLRRFITEIGKEEIKGYTTKIEDKYAREICHFWISALINRSYVYYDDVIDVLKVMKKITGEEEWKEYISTLMKDNKGKKKLLEKIRKLSLQFP